MNFHNINYNLGIVSWKRFRKGRGFAKEEVSQSSKISVLPIVGDPLLRLFTELINLPRLIQVLQERLLVRVIFELLNQLFHRFFAYKLLRNFCPMRFGGLRMFLLLDQVDPVAHFANSASVQLEAPWRLIYLMEKLLLNLHAYRFSQYKSQVVCCRERLRVIVFDKNAILSSERALNCTQYTVFWWGLQVFLYGVRSLACPSRIEFLPCCDHRPSDSLQWKTRIACPLWDFFLLGSIHFWLLNVFHLKFPTVNRCTRLKSSGKQYVVLQCRINEITPECPWIARKCRKCLEELGFKQYWKPFLWSSSLCPDKLSDRQLAIAKFHRTLPWYFP